MKYRCTIGKDGRKYYINKKTGKRVSSAIAKGKSGKCKIRLKKKRKGTYCVKGKGGNLYYFKDGKRISKTSIRSKKLKKMKCKKSKNKRKKTKSTKRKPKKKREVVKKVGSDGKEYYYDKSTGSRLRKKGTKKANTTKSGYKCIVGHDGKKYYQKDGKRVKKSDIPVSRLKKLEANCERSTSKRGKRKKDIEDMFNRDVKDLNLKKGCLERLRKKKLYDYQRRVVDYMVDNDGLLVCHSTGCGKTLTAVAASQCFLDNNRDGIVLIVCPTSQVLSFENEIVTSYGTKYKDRYIVMSYNNALMNKDILECKNKFMILDEVQSVKNFKGKTYEAIIDCAVLCKKRMVLTATPYMNSLLDFIPILNIINGNKYLVGSEYPKKNKDPRTKHFIDHKVLLKNNVDFVTICRKFLKIHYQEKTMCDDRFPEVKERYVVVEMSDKWERKYQKLITGERVKALQFLNPEKFYNAHRRVVNKVGNDEYFSNKLKKMLKVIKGGKTLIFTNWIEYGLRPITKFLEVNEISYGRFFGDLSMQRRKELVDRYNDNDMQVLIITSAGSEGLDLKGVRNVIVMDPVWNYSTLKQIIGRGVRLHSHAHLPPQERVVNVYKMMLVEKGKKELWDRDDDVLSGDALLYNIIRKKEGVHKNLDVMMKSLSI
jgi:superfamily II DNA or RNA helicase